MPKYPKNIDSRALFFASEYLVDLNATRAAIRAGYSAKSAGSAASRLLKNVKVKRYLEANMKKRSEKIEVKSEDVLRELVRISKADLRQVFDEDGSVKPVSEWPDDVAAFVSSIETNELYEGSGQDRRQVGVVRKIKLWPKVEALELLGKHLGLFLNKVESSVKIVVDTSDLTDEQLTEIANAGSAKGSEQNADEKEVIDDGLRQGKEKGQDGQVDDDDLPPE